MYLLLYVYYVVVISMMLYSPLVRLLKWLGKNIYMSNVLQNYSIVSYYIICINMYYYYY